MITAQEILDAWEQEFLREPIRFLFKEMRLAGVNDPERQLSAHFKGMARTLDERAGDAPASD